MFVGRGNRYTVAGKVFPRKTWVGGLEESLKNYLSSLKANGDELFLVEEDIASIKKEVPVKKFNEQPKKEVIEEKVEEPKESVSASSDSVDMDSVDDNFDSAPKKKSTSKKKSSSN